MAAATICDQCGKLLDGEQVLATNSGTDLIKLDITYGEGDWCDLCAKKALAEAGKVLWDANKQSRKTK